MSKRFIDSDIFRKPHLRGLQAPYKLLWVYLMCECDHAGVWVPELDVSEIRLGQKFDEAETLERMKDAIHVLPDGNWLLIDFLALQYGSELCPENRVHRSVLSRLQSYDLSKIKGLPSPFQGAKEKDKDKDKVKKKAKTPEGESEGKPWEADPIQLRINALWNRRASTPWKKKELDAYREIHFEDEDLLAIEAYYTAPASKFDRDIRRQDIVTLLNNWPGEVDRANKFLQNRGSKQQDLIRNIFDQ